MSRPTKLTENFLTKAEEILKEKDGINALVCTDKELISLINEKLPEAERITDRTFRNWTDKDESPNFIKLKEIVKKARIIQKISLIELLKQSKPGEWQKYAWLLERKFLDFSKSDLPKDLSLEDDSNLSHLTIEVVHANKEMKAMNSIDEFFDREK